VIAKDLTIDSLAIMDMVMELEDRFDVSIPMSVMPRSIPSTSSPTRSGSLPPNPL
jgi:acyl carrier protein